MLAGLDAAENGRDLDGWLRSPEPADRHLTATAAPASDTLPGAAVAGTVPRRERGDGGSAKATAREGAPVTHRAGVRAVVGLYLLLLVVWVIWGQLVTSGLIVRAYRGEGPAFLQRVLQAQGPRPLADYLEFWRRSVWALAALGIGAGGVFWVMTRPRFQRAWDSARGLAPEVRPASDLGRGRLVRVRCFILLLLAAEGVSIVSWLELWPFSPYKMFSETRRASDVLIRYRVFGIPAGDPTAELWITPAMLAPLTNSSIQRFAAQARGGPAPERSLQAFAAALLEVYEVGHRRATHHGPRLLGLRLYEDVWSQLDASARDAERPHRRTVLVTVRRDG
jgi:hypothetical protein